MESSVPYACLCGKKKEKKTQRRIERNGQWSNLKKCVVNNMEYGRRFHLYMYESMCSNIELPDKVYLLRDINIQLHSFIPIFLQVSQNFQTLCNSCSRNLKKPIYTDFDLFSKSKKNPNILLQFKFI